MLHRDDVLELEAVARTPGPTVTLIVSVDPRDPRNARQGWRLRADEALGRLAAPPEQVRRARAALPEGAATGRTLVLVVDDQRVLRVPLQIELTEEAHYGAPYLATLLDELGDRERCALLCLDERAVRLCCVFAGEIEELTDRLPALDPAAWEVAAAVLEEPERAAHHAEETGRVDATLAGRRHRALLAIGRLLERAVDDLGCDHVVIAGPGERPRELEAALPDHLRHRVTGTIGARLDESPAELLERVEALEPVRRQTRDLELVRQAVEQGVVGTDATLAALDEGRVYRLVFAGAATRELRCGVCGLTARTPGACEACGGDVLEAPLDELLPALARRRGATIARVHGEAHERLCDLGGLAGLVRY